MHHRNKWKFSKLNRPEKFEWICVVIAALLFSACYLYGDLIVTSESSLNVWTCVNSGTLPYFYQTTYPGLESHILGSPVTGGAYDFMIYLIFAIYNFPLWIWEKITGFRMLMFYPSRLYIKGIIAIFSGISAWLTYKIVRECNIEKDVALWAPILFLSSSLFFTAEVVIGGYEIISVCFTLFGIWCYIRNNNKGFIAGFAIAIATKLFAAWIFIPLLLLRQKNILKILRDGILSLSLIIIPKLFFLFSQRLINLITVPQVNTVDNVIESSTNTAASISTVAATSNGIIAHANIINKALFPEEVTASMTFIAWPNLPLVFVGMFTIWILCYLNKKSRTNEEIIYLCMVTMGVFILTAGVHPYWIILLVPYIILIQIMHLDKFQTNLFLEMVFSLGYILCKGIQFPGCFNMNLIENMLQPNYQFGYDHTVNDAQNYGILKIALLVSNKVGIDLVNIMHVFSALFVVGFILFIIMNYPRNRKEDNQVLEIRDQRKWLYLRFLGSCVVGALPICGLMMYVFM